MLKEKTVLNNRYEIDRLIAKGGMSYVYLAFDKNLQVYRAVKEPIEGKNYQRNKSALLRETEIMAKMDYYSFPKIIEQFSERIDPYSEETVFVVMEYIVGKSLMDTIENNRLSSNRVLELGMDVAAGLQYMHEKGYVFRDVKPQNIILHEDGRARLIDFGIVCKIGEDAKPAGTLRYAPSEQIRLEKHGNKKVYVAEDIPNERWDIYALGATLYHLATGEEPTPGDIGSIRAIDYTLPLGLDVVISKCVAKNPRDRYQSCDEVREALKNCGDLTVPYVAECKRMISLFWTFVIAAIICVIAGTAAIVMHSMEIANNYEVHIENARASYSNADDRFSAVDEAIAVDPGRIEAYEEIWNIFYDQLISGEKESLTQQDANEHIVKKLDTNVRNALNSRYKERAAQLYGNIGLLYMIWYGDKTEADLNAIKNACTWYEYAYEITSSIKSNEGNEWAKIKNEAESMHYLREVVTKGGFKTLSKEELEQLYNVSIKYFVEQKITDVDDYTSHICVAVLNRTAIYCINKYSDDFIKNNIANKSELIEMLKTCIETSRGAFNESIYEGARSIFEQNLVSIDASIELINAIKGGLD